MNILLIIAIAFAVLVFLRQYYGRYLFDYQIDDKGITILLFTRFPLKVINYKDIVNITKVDCVITAGIYAWKYTNALWRKQNVFIQVRGATLSDVTVIISPDEADFFITEVLRLKRERKAVTQQ